MALYITGSDGVKRKIAGLGIPGKSAYESAKENGYQGTEEEFYLELKTVTEKQDKITGIQGQVIGFDQEGNPIAQEAPSGLPDGGQDGKILGYTLSGPLWIDAPRTDLFKISETEPEDTNLLWINSSNNTMNYYNGDSWVPIVGVWG